MEKNKKIQKEIDSGNRKTISRLGAINAFYNELCGLREERPDLVNLPTNQQIAQLTFKQISELLDELIKKNLVRIQNAEIEKEKMSAEMIQKRLEKEYEARLLKQGLTDDVINAKYEAILATVDFLDDFNNSKKPLSSIYKLILEEKVIDTKYRLKFQDFELEAKEKVAKFVSKFYYDRYNDFIKLCYKDIENSKYNLFLDAKDHLNNFENKHDTFISNASRALKNVSKINLDFVNEAKALQQMIDLFRKKQIIFNSEDFLNEYLRIYKATCLKDVSAEEAKSIITRISNDLRNKFEPFENKCNSLNLKLITKSDESIARFSKRAKPIIFDLLKDLKRTKYNHGLCLNWAENEIKRLEKIQLPYVDGSKILALMLDWIVKSYKDNKKLPEARKFFDEYLRIYKIIGLKNVAPTEAKIIITRISNGIKNEFTQIEKDFKNSILKLMNDEGKSIKNIREKIKPIIFKLLQNFEKIKFDHKLCLEWSSKEIKRIKNIELSFVNEAKALEIMIDSFMESFSGNKESLDSKKFFNDYLRIYKMTCLKDISPSEIKKSLEKISDDVENKFEPIEKEASVSVAELSKKAEEKIEKIHREIKPIVFSLFKNVKKTKFDHEACLKWALEEIRHIKNTKLTFDEEAKVLEAILDLFIESFNQNQGVPNGNRLLDQYLRIYKDICLKKLPPKQADIKIAKISKDFNNKFKIIHSSSNKEITQAKKYGNSKINNIKKNDKLIIFQMLSVFKKTKFDHAEAISKARREIAKARNINLPFVLAAKALEQMLDLFMQKNGIENARDFLSKYLKIYALTFLKNASEHEIKKETSQLFAMFDKKFKAVDKKTVSLILRAKNEYKGQIGKKKSKIRALVNKLSKIDFSDHCLFTKDYIDARLLSTIQEAKIKINQ